MGCCSGLGARGARGARGPGISNNRLCIKNTCINEDDLKRLKGQKPFMIYQRTGHHPGYLHGHVGKYVGRAEPRHRSKFNLYPGGNN